MLNKLPETLYFCHHEIDNRHKTELERFSDYQYPNTEKWSQKRRQEFYSGRWCAFQCLMLQKATDINIPIAEDRSPIWPDNFVGSISHSSRYAAALVGHTEIYQAIGLDIQPSSSPKLADQLKHMILTSNEQSNLWHDEEKSYIFDLIFSAKETLFKALYPLCRTYFGHHDAEVIRIDTEKNELSIELLISLDDVWKQGSVFNIHYQVLKGELISWMFIPKGFSFTQNSTKLEFNGIIRCLPQRES